MSDHLKGIVEQIQKLADVPTRSKGNRVAAPPDPIAGGDAPASKG